MARHLQTVNKCPVCRSYAVNSLLTDKGPDIYRVNCWRCCVFRITGTFSAILGSPRRQTDFLPDRISNFSSYIRENQEQLFSEADIDFVVGIRTPSVAEKATKLLRFFAKQHPYPGEQFRIQYGSLPACLSYEEAHTADVYVVDHYPNRSLAEILLPAFAASWSRNAGEFFFVLNNILRTTSEFIETGHAGDPWLLISPKGWDYLASLEAASAESTTAFVAMWFNEKTDPLWREAIRPAVYDAGYEPLRIDTVEHTNKIDDEIIARIRACKFLVADFTEQRGGVYFESGFARGLGKQVIWCVHEDHLKGVHFDNRQFNFLKWKPDALAAFRTALTLRIEAIFGKGPVKLNAGTPQDARQRAAGK